MKEEKAAEHLDAIEVVPEPIVSTKEDVDDAFNDWYLMKIYESTIPKKSKSTYSVAQTKFNKPSDTRHATWCVSTSPRGTSN